MTMGPFFGSFAVTSGSGPIASGDFTNIATANAADGVYTLNGSPAMLTDIVDLSGPDNNFNPATDIDADGVFCPSDITRIFNIKEPLLSTLLSSGYTATIDFAFTSTASTGFFAHDNAYNIQPEADAQYEDPTPQRVSLNDVLGNSAADTLHPPVPGQTNRLAVTMAADHISASINGAPVLRLSGAGLDPSLTQIAFSFSSGETDGRLRSFAFYALLDDADLPTLSALS